MLKSHSRGEPELIGLCQERRWAAVYDRASAHPGEATPSDVSLRGAGTTVLSLALRLGAPRRVLVSLHAAHPHQVGVIHRNRGTLLHDALRFRVAEDVLDFVVQATIEFQQSPERLALLSGGCSTRFLTTTHHSKLPQFQHVHIQNNRVIGGPNILGVQDELGRTVLHYIVESIQYNFVEPKKRIFFWNMFLLLLRHFPDLVGITDTDGNTPLISLLVLQKPAIPHFADQFEDDICSMAKVMLDISAEKTINTRAVTRPWRSVAFSSTLSSEITLSSPLYFGILHDRYEKTIQVLLQGYEKTETNGCSAVVTQHYENCLHVAVTMRSSPEILRIILMEYKKASLAKDVYGLTPIDWLWINHVKICNGQGSRPSRRRYLSREYLDWHEWATINMVVHGSNDDDDYDYDCGSSSGRLRPHHSNSHKIATLRGFHKDLLRRMEILVPLAATLQERPKSEDDHDHDDDGHDESGKNVLDLLHAVCALSSCCLGMVRLVLEYCPVDHLRKRDLVSGRLPLHFGAARVLGYRVRLPIGAARAIHTLQEKSPALEILSRYPEAAKCLDGNFQLPLHVAIDSAKEIRQKCLSSIISARRREEFLQVVLAEEELLKEFLAAYPSSLGRRDGKTRLFPWQQAAVGRGASLTTIYNLLRREPTHFSSKQG